MEVHGTIRANHSWMNADARARVHDMRRIPPIEQNGNTIRIGHFDDRGREHDISISYEVIVPEQTKLHSESGSGDETTAESRGRWKRDERIRRMKSLEYRWRSSCTNGFGQRGTGFDQGRCARDFGRRNDSRARNCGGIERVERERRSKARTDGGWRHGDFDRVGRRGNKGEKER